MFRSLFLALFLAFGSSSTAVAATAPCAHSQAAIRSLLDNLQADSWNPTLAASCLDAAPGDDAASLAIQLLRILDARGHFIDFDDFPTDPEYVNADGAAHVAPITGFPQFQVGRLADGSWKFDRDLADGLPQIYASTFPFLAAFHEQLPPGAFQTIGPVAIWQLIYLAILILVSFLVGRIAEKLLSSQFVRMAAKFKVELSDKVAQGLRGPLVWASTGAVFLLGIPDMQLAVRPSQFLLFLSRTVLSIALVLIAVGAVDVATQFFAKRAEATDTKLDDQLIPLANRATKTALWILGGLFVVQNMGVDVTALLAGVSIGGLAFALAAKDTVENLFGSVTIFTDRPFQIGDTIEVNGVIGTVEEVGFRSTRLRTPVGSLISLPNGKVAGAQVDNLGARTRRRTRITLGLTYDSTQAQMVAFVEGIRAVLDGHEIVSPDSEVHFTGFGDSALEVMVHFFLEVPGWSDQLVHQQEIFLAFMGVAEDVGVSFAFPSQSLYVEQLPQARGASDAPS